jgi:hypothetical protein
MWKSDSPILKLYPLGVVGVELEECGEGSMLMVVVGNGELLLSSDKAIGLMMLEVDESMQIDDKAGMSVGPDPFFPTVDAS